MPKQYNYVKSYSNKKQKPYSEAEPYDEAMEKEETLRNKENPWKIQVDLEKEEKTEQETTTESNMEAYVSTKPVVYSQYGNHNHKKMSHKDGYKSRSPKKEVMHYGDKPAPYHLSYETEV